MPNGRLPGVSVAEEQAAALVQRLEQMIGSERVSRGSGVAIHGVRASLEVRPGDSEQLGRVLTLANEERLGACVAGGGTKISWGNRPERLDLVVSTRDLRGFSHIDADNLSLSVRAGTTVAEARAQARAINRVLPLDPARPAAATVGGVVATGDQGARGAGYGGLRDVVLGLSAVLADGSPVKFGGRTMKNVAGYDMTKLFVSSFGVLGVVTDITFRLLPRYETQALMILPIGSLDRAGEISAQILDSYLQPLALEVVSSGLFTETRVAATSSGLGGAGSMVPGDEPVMLAGFAGPRAAVARSVDELKDRYYLQPLAVLEGDEAESLYGALADVGSDSVPARGTRVRARITCPITRVWELARSAESGANARDLEIEYRIGAVRGTLDLLIDQGPRPHLGEHPEQEAGTGLEARLDSEARPDSEAAAVRLTALLVDLRREAEAVEGALTVRDGLTWLTPGFDAWGGPGSSVQIMRRIKERFDPHRVLNPGRFVGSI